MKIQKFSRDCITKVNQKKGLGIQFYVGKLREKNGCPEKILYKIYILRFFCQL